MKRKLKQLAKIQTGYTFRSKIFPEIDGKISIIQMKDLDDNNQVSMKNVIRINLDKMKKQHFIKKGDLVFRSRGEVTEPAIIAEDPGKAVVAAPLIVIKIKNKKMLLPEYLNWFLTQKKAQDFLNKHARGSTQKMINKKVLEEAEVFVPALEVQKQIMELANLSKKENDILYKIAEKRELLLTNYLIKIAKGE